MSRSLGPAGAGVTLAILLRYPEMGDSQQVCYLSRQSRRDQQTASPRNEALVVASNSPRLIDTACWQGRITGAPGPAHVLPSLRPQAGTLSGLCDVERFLLQTRQLSRSVCFLELLCDAATNADNCRGASSTAAASEIVRTAEQA